jgi:hypothetical protein
MVTFFNVITCPFSKTISCNKPDSNILFNEENIAIMTFTLVQGQGEDIGHNLLHIVCYDLCADSESEKILSIGELTAELSSFECHKG